MSQAQNKMMRKSAAVLLFVGLLLAFAACTSETYKSGDGDYSYMRSDFAVITTNSKSQVVSFVTDEERNLTLKEPVTVDKIKSDTTYRALVYYDDTTESSVTLRTFKLVNVCTPFSASRKVVMLTDPTGWESMWISYNKAYLNLCLNLKVGVSDDENADAKQLLGVRNDSIVGNHHYFTLYHNQNSVPEYYTYKSYMSIPLDSSFKRGDIITMTVNTYDGTQSKTVVMP